MAKTYTLNEKEFNQLIPIDTDLNGTPYPSPFVVYFNAEGDKLVVDNLYNHKKPLKDFILKHHN